MAMTSSSRQEPPRSCTSSRKATPTTNSRRWPTISRNRPARRTTHEHAKKGFLKAGVAGGCAGLGLRGRSAAAGPGARGGGRGGYGGANGGQVHRCSTPHRGRAVEPTNRSSPARSRTSCWALQDDERHSPPRTRGSRQPRRAIRSRHGTAIDADKKQCARQGDVLSYDRVIVSPGIDFIAGAIPALAAPSAIARAARLEGRPADGGAAPPARGHARRRVYVLSIPAAPTGAAGPYERACRSRPTSRRGKPRSKSSFSTRTPTSPPRAALQEGLANSTAASSSTRNSKAVDVTCAPRREAGVR